MPDYTLVESPDDFAPVLQTENRIGVDTEFMRERTYNAQLCLVQVATAQRIYCVDPLAGQPLDAFWNAAFASCWVLHSGRQDMEVIGQAAGGLPGTVFDTQVAAGLLGYPPQIGYANLVTELFEVTLPKSHTRADWSRRPLAEALLAYAAEDVEYLLPLHDRLSEALEAKDRLAWAEEDSAALLDPALYETDPATAIDRLKAARNLRGRRRAAAVRLAAWREREAQRLNRPRQWIVKDAVLVDLASRLPESTDALADMDGIAPGLVRRAGRDIVGEIRASAGDDQGYEPPSPPEDAEKKRLKRLQDFVADRAGALGIAAEILAPRRDLALLASGAGETSRVLSGWRAEVVGEELARLG
jgi:ribonuclease D